MSVALAVEGDNSNLSNLHQARYLDEWHVDGDKIQRCLHDKEGLVLATDTLDGDVAALVAFAKTGSDLTAHDMDVARKLERRSSPASSCSS